MSAEEMSTCSVSNVKMANTIIRKMQIKITGNISHL